MRKFVQKFILYFSLIVGVCLAYAMFCDNYFYKGHYLGDSKRYWILSLENKQYDYAVLGSSRGNASFNIGLFDSLTNRKGISLSLNGSAYSENYITLVKFLEKNSVKEVFLQYCPYSFMSNKSFSNPFHGYAYLPYWKTNDEIYYTLKDNIEAWTILNTYIPYGAYFKYNNYYAPYRVAKAHKGALFSERKDYNIKNGNKLYDKKTKVFSEEISELEFSLNPKDAKYFKLIEGYLNSKNIRLILYTAPHYSVSSGNYEEFKGNLGLEYSYTFNEQWYSREYLFSDEAHLNQKGRELFTRELAHYFTETEFNSLSK